YALTYRSRRCGGCCQGQGRTCARANDPGNNSMVYASGAISVAADDFVLSVDSIERGKSRARKIVHHETIWRHKKYAVRCSGGVRIAADDQVVVVVAEKDRARRTRGINPCMETAVAVAKESVS